MRHIKRLHKGLQIIKQIERNVEDFPDCALAWAIALTRLGKSRHFEQNGQQGVSQAASRMSGCKDRRYFHAETLRILTILTYFHPTAEHLSAELPRRL
jgi:hypothetical protein